MKNNIITIIIPVYNAEKFLKRCLDSVINVACCEVILVNDGSTDGSLEICSYYASKNSNITVINQSNQGVATARNVGLDRANGKWIMFLDADDYLLDSWKKDVFKVISMSNKSKLICFSQDAKKSIQNSSVIIAAILGDSSKYEDIGDSFRYVVSKLYSRSLLNDKHIRFQKEIINGEDVLFNVSVLSNILNVSLYGTGIYVFAKQLNSSTNRYNPKIIKSEIQFHEFLDSILMKNKRREFEYLLDTLYLNGIFVVLYYLTNENSMKLKNSKLIIEKLVKLPSYNDRLLKLNYYKPSISKIKYTSLFLVSKKCFYWALLNTKIFNYLKKVKYKFQKNKISKII